MTSVLGSVTNWFVGFKDPGPDDTGPQREEEEEAKKTDDAETAKPDGAAAVAAVESPLDSENGETGGEEATVTEKTSDANSGAALDVDLQEVSEKAIHAAKELGS